MERILCHLISSSLAHQFFAYAPSCISSSVKLCKLRNKVFDEVRHLLFAVKTRCQHASTPGMTSFWQWERNKGWALRRAPLWFPLRSCPISLLPKPPIRLSDAGCLFGVCVGGGGGGGGGKERFDRSNKCFLLTILKCSYLRFHKYKCYKCVLFITAKQLCFVLVLESLVNIK